MTDTEKLIRAIERAKQQSADNGLDGIIVPFKETDMILELLKEQEANKPKIGHWIFESQYYEAWSHTCSECGKRTTTAVNTFANWCWNCGAKMGGEAE